MPVGNRGAGGAGGAGKFHIVILFCGSKVLKQYRNPYDHLHHLNHFSITAATADRRIRAFFHRNSSRYRIRYTVAVYPDEIASDCKVLLGVGRCP